MENEIIKIVSRVLVLMKAEKISANLFMLKREILQEANVWSCQMEKSRQRCDILNSTTCSNKV